MQVSFHCNARSLYSQQRECRRRPCRRHLNPVRPVQLTTGLGLEVRLDAGGCKGKGVFATKVRRW